jgi:hypothetical protein
MFVFQKLGQLLQNAAPTSGSQSDLVQLAAGQLYAADASAPDVFQCKLAQSTLTVRRGTQPYQYELIAAPATASPDDEDALDALDNERVFLIDKGMLFHKLTEPCLAFRWTDPVRFTMIYHY